MSQINKNSAKIIIVGAGISGLSTAVSLFQNGFDDITLLEARNRLGGRMHSIRTNHLTFEAGAQWIQKGLEETFQNLSSQVKLCAYPMKTLCYHEEYKQLHDADGDIIEEANEKFSDIFDQADYSDASNVYGDLLSFTTANWKKYFQKSRLLNLNVLEELYQNMCCSYRSYDGCNSLADLATFSGYKKIGEESLLVHGSFSTLLQTMNSFLPSDCVKFHHVVTKIHWQEEECGKASGKPVKVVFTDKSGNIHEKFADHVVVTFPLGFLKRHHEDIFEPSLPHEKIASINRLGFGITNKIILFYEKRFWKEGIDELFFIWKNQNEENRPWWKSIVTTHILPDVANNRYYLVIFLPGKEAIQIEKEDPENVGRVCSETFQKFLDLSEPPVPKITYVTKWASDPYTYGSYTHIPVGSSNQHCATLAKPLLSKQDSIPRVLFAGESTHSDYFSTVHGAYFSGQREADRLVLFYSK